MTPRFLMLSAEHVSDVSSKLDAFASLFAPLLLEGDMPG